MDATVLPKARIKRLVQTHADLKQAQDSYPILQHLYLRIVYTLYRRCRAALRERTGNLNGRIRIEDVGAAARHMCDELPNVDDLNVTPRRCGSAGGHPYPACVYVPSTVFAGLIHTIQTCLHHGTSKTRAAMTLMHLFAERVFINFVTLVVRTFVRYAQHKVIRRRGILFALTAFGALRTLHELPIAMPDSWFQGDADEDYEQESSSSSNDDDDDNGADGGGDSDAGGGGAGGGGDSDGGGGGSDGGGGGGGGSDGGGAGDGGSDGGGDEGFDYGGDGGDGGNGRGDGGSPAPRTPSPPNPTVPPVPPRSSRSTRSSGRRNSGRATLRQRQRQQTPRQLNTTTRRDTPQRNRRAPAHLADYERNLDMRTVRRILPANRRVVRIPDSPDNALRALVMAYNHTPPAPHPRLTIRAAQDLLDDNTTPSGGIRDRRNFAALARLLRIRIIVIDTNGEEGVAYGDAGLKTVFVQRTAHYDPIYLLESPRRQGGQSAESESSLEDREEAFVPLTRSQMDESRRNGERDTLEALRRTRVSRATQGALTRLRAVIRATPVSRHDISPDLTRYFPPRQRDHMYNSWLYMPIILGALQVTPAATGSEVVNEAVMMYHRIFQAANITLAMVRDPLDYARHMSTELQEALLSLSPPHANVLALYALSTFQRGRHRR
ncbi:hypothetical protein JKP88DRAFT_240889 [Tribonema minus]|uniref:Uncharacterized protein n=1 Tax=Tribonema minus TaxID=303371 RepID=A0A836CH26_9STRA|nr:hypothetical protein JKP88DRAFT_240889 [Tribonema minus]